MSRLLRHRSGCRR